MVALPLMMRQQRKVTFVKNISVDIGFEK